VRGAISDGRPYRDNYCHKKDQLAGMSPEQRANRKSEIDENHMFGYATRKLSGDLG